MMPPTNYTPRQLWAKLQEAPRPTKTVDFPRKDAAGQPIGQVVIWPLNSDEQIRCGVEAEKLIRAELPDVPSEKGNGFYSGYTNAVACEQLYRACRDPIDTSVPAFPSAQAIRQAMTADEVSTLYDLYLETTTELGPIVSTMTKAEMDAWIERLIEGGSHDWLSFFTSRNRTVLMLAMAERLRSFRTAPGSAGLPPDGGRSVSPDRVGD